MSSYRTRFDVQPTITGVGGSTGGSSLLGDVGRLRLVQDVVGDSHAALTSAAAAIEQVEQEIDHLWFDAMKQENSAMSQRLAEMSHALQRAARLLEPDNAIG
jgi:methyl-accepting chemotaxis protein